MPYKLLVFAADRPDGKRAKGYMSSIQAPDHVWGNKEGLPTFIQVDVTDGVSHLAARAWQDQWVIDYVFTVLDDQPTYTDYRVEVDPEVISASDKGRAELKAEMQAYIDDAEPDSIWYGSITSNYTSSSMGVRIPKPHSRLALKADFKDKFQFILEIDRYYFKSQGVDWVIGQGGHVQIKQVKALNYIVDKFDE